jgi:hypothetical protein
MEESPPLPGEAHVMRIVLALQGAAEYGALTGGGGGAPRGRSPAQIADWASEHQLVLLAVAAGLFLLWMVMGAARRR